MRSNLGKLPCSSIQQRLIGRIYHDSEAESALAPDGDQAGNAAARDAGPSWIAGPSETAIPARTTSPVEHSSPTKTTGHEEGFASKSVANPADDNKDKGKGKAKAIESEPPAALQAKPWSQRDTAAALLLRPEYWSKREYVSRKSQGREGSRFMRPSYSRMSTDCEPPSHAFRTRSTLH